MRGDPRSSDGGAVKSAIAASWRVIPGLPDSGVVLHVPHSARRIPASLRGDLLLDDHGLERELLAMTDAHTDVIADLAVTAAGNRPWRFVNALSRLVIDPERFPDEREEMTRVGMGAVYTRTSDGRVLREPTPAQREALLATYFRSYAAAFTDLVSERLATTGQVTIIDVHSYATRALPYELHGAGPRPAICIGTDAMHTPAPLVEAAREAFAGFSEVGLDAPFAGTYVPLAHYGTEPRVRSLMIEIRRDQYLDEQTGEADPAGVRALGDALGALIQAIEGATRD